eukprot:gene5669-6545_t
MARKGIDQHIPSEISSAVSRAQVSRTDSQAVYIMYSLLNPSSFWHEYVSILPKTLSTTLYYTNEEMEELQASRVREYSESRLESVEYHYEGTFERLAKEHPEFSKKEYTMEMFKWALACIWSRAFSLSSADGGMVPLADMFNAEEMSKSKIYPKVTDEMIEYYASMDIEQGEQIFTPYGVYKSLSSGQMLMDYGFVYDQGTPSDTATVTVAPFEADEPMYDLKRHLLEFNDITSEHFTITKGKLPEQLLMFGRIKNLQAKDAKAAQSHFISGDRHLPLTRKSERAALRYVVSLITRQLDSYKTTLEY